MNNIFSIILKEIIVASLSVASLAVTSLAVTSLSVASLAVTSLIQAQNALVHHPHKRAYPQSCLQVCIWIHSNHKHLDFQE